MREGVVLSAWRLSATLRPRRQRSAPKKGTAKPQPRDLEYLSWAVRYRLFTAGQLQRRFALSRSTAYRQIERLRTLNFIKPAVVRVINPNWPECYQLTGRGIGYIRDGLVRSGRALSPDLTMHNWKSRGTVVSAALHELCVTEFGIGLERTVGERGDLELLHTEIHYRHPRKKLRFAHQGEMRAVVPDAGFVTAALRPAKPPALTLTWLEIDLSTESNRVVLDKLARYHHHAKAKLGQARIKRLYQQFGPEYRHHAWRIAVVVHNPTKDNADHQRLASFVTQGLLLPAVTRNRIYITTADDLARTENHRQPLANAIWVSMYDLRNHTDAYRRFAHQADKTNRPEQRKRQYVEQLLEDVPRHYLFPPAMETVTQKAAMAT